MSLIATAVKHLIAAGVTGDALLAAIAEMESQVRAEPKRRSAGAERQARYEARKRQEASEMTPSDENDASDAEASGPSLSLLPNENNSNPTTHTHPETHTPRTRKGTRLPADWIPADLDDRTASEVSNWPDGAVDRELSKFRDWASAAPGAKGVKSDWDATWRNWLRKAHDEGRYDNGNSRKNAGPYPSRNGARSNDGAIVALDRKMGLDGIAREPGCYDDRSGPPDRGRALAGPRSLF